MHGHSATRRVRTGRGLCKPPRPARPRKPGHWLLFVISDLLLMPGCHLAAPPRTVTLETLENAPAATTVTPEYVVVTDPQSLRALCTPLGSRLGLIQVRSAREWDLLARAAPQLHRCPDLSRGIVVGIVCWAGTPVDGQWPVRIAGVQVHRGAGLVRADFHGGTYLPDGATYLETAHVPGLAGVLVVDVGGATFFPE